MICFFWLHKGSKYTRKEIIIWNIRTLVKIHKGEVMKVLNIYIYYTEALGSKFSTIQKCWDQSPYKHVLYGDQVSKTTTAAVDRNSRLVWWRLIFKKNRKETRYMYGEKKHCLFFKVWFLINIHSTLTVAWKNFLCCVSFTIIHCIGNTRNLVLLTILTAQVISTTRELKTCLFSR